MSSTPPLRRAGPVRRMLGYVVLSLFAYLVTFAVVRKPLSIGVYREMIDLKRQRFEATEPPRILILAGSNARVSHSALVMQEALGRPTTNGGLSADVSLLLMLQAFDPLLRRSDTVYLPLEYDAYSVDDRSRKVDYLYLASYDRRGLLKLPPVEILQALFSFDLRYLAGALFESAAVLGGRSARRGDLNSFGDQQGHDAAYAEQRSAAIRAMSVKPVTRSMISEGSRAVSALRAFLASCRTRGITVVGGLPTTFSDQRIEPAVVSWLRTLYERGGQRFLTLQNQSQYPRAYFSDTSYHLRDDAARAHTRLVAEGLRPMLPRN